MSIFPMVLPIYVSSQTHDTGFFINLACWVRVFIFLRKQTFSFVSELVNSHLNLLIGELMKP